MPSKSLKSWKKGHKALKSSTSLHPQRQGQWEPGSSASQVTWHPQLVTTRLWTWWWVWPLTMFVNGSEHITMSNKRYQVQNSHPLEETNVMGLTSRDHRCFRDCPTAHSSSPISENVTLSFLSCQWLMEQSFSTHFEHPCGFITQKNHARNILIGDCWAPSVLRHPLRTQNVQSWIKNEPL